MRLPRSESDERTYKEELDKRRSDVETYLDEDCEPTVMFKGDITGIKGRLYDRDTITTRIKELNNFPPTPSRVSALSVEEEFGEEFIKDAHFSISDRGAFRMNNGYRVNKADDGEESVAAVMAHDRNYTFRIRQFKFEV